MTVRVNGADRAAASAGSRSASQLERDIFICFAGGAPPPRACHRSPSARGDDWIVLPRGASRPKAVENRRHFLGRIVPRGEPIADAAGALGEPSP